MDISHSPDWGLDTHQNASSFFQQNFGRDKLGRITRKTESLQGVNRAYDYSYDLAG